MSTHNLIPGYATAEGTRRFAARFAKAVSPDFYTDVEGLRLSTLGFGSYLGDPSTEDDQLMEMALKKVILSGVNVIDTAGNYRAQRAERVIGKVLSELIDSGKIQRDEVFVGTKAGFIPFDGDYPDDPNGYLRDRFIKTKILTPKDVVAGCHSLAPNYIRDQFEQSRRNLKLETIDLFYLHNPETQLEEVSTAELYHRMHQAFGVLEDKIKDGLLKFSGVATWNAFRVPSRSKEALLISETAENSGRDGASPNFKFIQLPFNLAMPQALTEKNQSGDHLSALVESKKLGIHVFTSASLMQAKILASLPANLDSLAPGKSAAVKALNFARSAPGVDVALCGMKQEAHVLDNLGLLQVPRVSNPPNSD